MANILLVYASMTGNTEEMAEAIAAGIQEAGGTLKVQMVMDAGASDLPGYDGIVLGAYTWGDGELPDEFLEFYEDMSGLPLIGAKSAVFGSCDSGYPAYGAAVDMLIDKLKECGSNVVLEGLKIELAPSGGEKEQCKQFGRQFVQLLTAKEESNNGTAV